MLTGHAHTFTFDMVSAAYAEVSNFRSMSLPLSARLTLSPLAESE